MEVINTDLLIIGAGPAGCMAAIGALKKAPGLDVVMIDKTMQPRHRIGEILLTQTIQEFDRYGLVDDIRAAADKYGWERKFGFVFVYGEDRTPWHVWNDHPALMVTEEDTRFPAAFKGAFRGNPDSQFTLMVRRHEFDSVLRDLAAREGARLIEAEAREAKIFGSGEDTVVGSITIRLPDGGDCVIHAKEVIDASGQSAFFARRTERRRPLNNRQTSARYAYFRGVDFAEAERHGMLRQGANILFHGGGWSWVAHLGNGLTSIGVVSSDWSVDYFEKLAGIPEARHFGLENCEVVDYLGEPAPGLRYIHADFSYETVQPWGRNWNTAGDAARFLDPLLSQGATTAIAFGGLAGTISATRITEGTENALDFARYHRMYKAEVMTLQHLVDHWYTEDQKLRCPEEWLAVAGRLGSVFGRPVGNDVESLRFIANMENVHVLLNGGLEEDIISHLLSVGATDPEAAEPAVA